MIEVVVGSAQHWFIMSICFLNYSNCVTWWFGVKSWNIKHISKTCPKAPKNASKKKIFARNLKILHPKAEIIETTFCLAHFIPRNFNNNYPMCRLKVLLETNEFSDCFSFNQKTFWGVGFVCFSNPTFPPRRPFGLVPWVPFYTLTGNLQIFSLFTEIFKSFLY